MLETSKQPEVDQTDAGRMSLPEQPRSPEGDSSSGGKGGNESGEPFAAASMSADLASFREQPQTERPAESMVDAANESKADSGDSAKAEQASDSRANEVRAASQQPAEDLLKEE